MLVTYDEMPAARVVYGVLARIAEPIRELIKERVTAGMTAVRKAGRVGYPGPAWAAGHPMSSAFRGW